MDSPLSPWTVRVSIWDPINGQFWRASHINYLSKFHRWEDLPDPGYAPGAATGSPRRAGPATPHRDGCLRGPGPRSPRLALASLWQPQERTPGQGGPHIDGTRLDMYNNDPRVPGTVLWGRVRSLKGWVHFASHISVGSGPGRSYSGEQAISNMQCGGLGTFHQPAEGAASHVSTQAENDRPSQPTCEHAADLFPGCPFACAVITPVLFLFDPS